MESKDFSKFKKFPKIKIINKKILFWLIARIVLFKFRFQKDWSGGICIR